MLGSGFLTELVALLEQASAACDSASPTRTNLAALNTTIRQPNKNAIERAGSRSRSIEGNRFSPAMH
jgi:hypothetical protein